MIISNLKIFGWENALIGMRYPYDSDAKGDSSFVNGLFTIGENDRKLLMQLCIAGKSHRKILRMIHVQMAIKMPISWWMHMDTYKVATVANSRSRMNILGKRLLTIEDFECRNTIIFKNHLNDINYLISLYQTNGENKEHIWRNLLDILPQSFLQERMWDGNYETLLTILLDRYNKERLKTEWHFFCEYILHNCLLLGEIYAVLRTSK